MDAKLREDLFRRYVTSLENRLEEGAGEGGGDKQGARTEEALISTATALLGSYQPDPGQRFHMVRFYDIAESSLRTQRAANLQTLETAFATLETICTNLLLFPWKKEFRCIKTFTGPYVYQLQSVICDAELRSLLRSMGYSRDQELRYHVRDHSGGFTNLHQLAFELLLAQAECRLLAEVVSMSRGSASELEAVEVRRSTREDAAGCADTLRRQDSLTGDLSQLSVRLVDIERAHLRQSGRPSKSVDVTDSAGHWHQASKPVLKASLSLRKEPLFVDTEEEMKDEIIRPNLSLYPIAAPPSYSPDFFPIQSPPSEPYSYQLSSLDEVDLYTERGLCGHQTPSRPPSRELREARDSWVLKGHVMKCQGCGMGCPSLLSCQRCDMILCPSCHVLEPAPCCGFQDYSKTARPLDGYMPMKEKLSVYSNAHTHPHPHPLPHAHSHSLLLDKAVMSTKLFPSKSVGPSASPVVSSGSSIVGERLGVGGSRCGFCNKPGASHTCVNCSKVSCDTCMSLYASDGCTRKTPHHNFVPNHQLNFKSSSISHLVYR
ncbi:spermatogenesis-associated protein 2 [Xyrauchen texanus]|uniref:spermatogenesis-associated protein 2 n=1 Tax=Xyrauchen texanus TaxID=154827 RepID=UPI002241E2EC|nr:spermatogenesis-associated protein 2 [Xyrauchen texanus]XP_051961400.1 spermatogenesis-associated protein 2 [Xyrauchen texanus]XP_051961401.1 spermatogenesis-associated protein 2 [Xyrauchen texanus]